MSRRLLFIFVLTIVLAGIAGLVFYVNTYFIPVRLKSIVTEKAQQYLNRPVSIAEIHFNPLRGGFVILGLTIKEKDRPDNIFITIKEIRFNAPIPSLLTGQRIIIPVIAIKEPYVHIIRSAAGQWNFSDLAQKKPGGHSQPFFLGEVLLEKANVDLSDETTSPVTTESFTGMNLNIRLSLKKGIIYSFSTNINTDASVKVDGDYTVLEKKLRSKISVRKLDVERFMPYMPPQAVIQLSRAFFEEAEAVLVWQKQKLALEGKARGDADIHFPAQETHIQGKIAAESFKFERNNKRWQAAADFHSETTRISTPHNILISGGLSSRNVRVTGQNGQTTVAGSVQLEKGDVLLPDDYHVGGDILIKDCTVRVKDSDFDATGNVEIVHGRLKKDQALTVTGHLLADKIKVVRKKNAWKLSASARIDQADAVLPAETRLSGVFVTDNLNITSQDKTTKARSSFTVQDGTLRFKEGKTLLGSPAVDIQLTHRADASRLSYSGSIAFQDATLRGFAPLDPVTNISGKVNFEPDKFTTKSLSFVTLQTPAQLSGSLSGFTDPVINIDLAAKNVDIQKISGVFFAGALAEHKLSPDGRADLDLAYKGPAASWADGQLNLTADVKNASLDGERLPAKLEKVTGRLTYKKDSLAWEGLNLSFKDIPLFLDGNLQNFARPVVTTRLKSEDIDLQTTIKILNNALTITSLSGTYLDSLFDLSGEIHLPPGQNPQLILKGRARMDLDNLEPLNQRFHWKLPGLKARGNLLTDLYFKGSLQELRRATFVISAQSSQISLHGYALQNLNMRIEQGDKPFSKLDIKTSAYGGEAVVSATADIDRIHIPFELSARLTGVDLARLKQETAWKNKEVSGILSLTASLEGALTHWRAVRGTGAMAIRDGAFYELNLLKGVWRLLLVKELKNIVFTDASASFVISDERIISQDLLLRSRPLDLYGMGWIGFNKDILFNIRADVKESEILQSDSILKQRTAILKQAEEYVTVKVSGKVDNPTFERVIVPAKMFKKTTGAILEGVQGILEGILGQ